MDKGRKSSNTAKKNNGPNIRSQQVSKERLTSISPKKLRSTPLRTKSSNDTTSFSTPLRTKSSNDTTTFSSKSESRDSYDDRFKALLKSMITESIESIVGSNVKLEKDIINKTLLERIIKLETEVVNNNALILEVQTLKNRVMTLEDENKQLLSRSGNSSDYSSEVSYLSEDKLPVGRGRPHKEGGSSPSRVSESMPISSSRGLSSSRGHSKSKGRPRTSSLERVKRAMRVPRVFSKPKKKVIRLADLEGKWKHTNNDTTTAESVEGPNNTVIWVIDAEGVASSLEEESPQTLNLHETLNFHHSSSSETSQGSSLDGWDHQSSSSGGWLIIREDGWEVDSSQSDIKKGLIIWQKRKDFTELVSNTPKTENNQQDIYDYEIWKRDDPPPPPPPPKPPVKKSGGTTFASLVRKKRPSINAMAGFSKVMKRGVLTKALASQINTAVVEVEPQMTKILKDIARGADGKLVGLEFKFKSIESLTSKIDRGVHNANLLILENMERRRTAEGSQVAKAEASHEKKQKKLKLKHNEERAGLSKMKELQTSTSMQEHDAQHAACVQANHIKSDLIAQKALAKHEKHAKEIEETAQKEGETEVDMAGIVWKISDALRYTVLISTERYTNTVKNALVKLQEAGMTPGSLKNYWGPGDGYQGINDVFLVPSKISPTGHVKVEVQFHTLESFQHKQAVHGMYEEYRVTKDPTRKVELWKESVEMADTIPVPEDVLSLPRLKTQPMPIETTLYVDLVLSRALLIQQGAVETITRICNNLSLPGYMSSKKVNAKVTSTLMSPSSVEFRIHSETLNYDKHHHKHHSRHNSVNSTGSSNEKTQGDGHITESEEIEMKLKDAALKIDDALVINVILDEDVYTTATELAMNEIFKSDIVGASSQDKDGNGTIKSTKSHKTSEGRIWRTSLYSKKKEDSFILTEMSEVKSMNGWSSPMLLKRTGPTGGIGFYCHATMEGEDDGVAFTPDDAYPFIIAFHTQASLAAQLGLQSAWLDYKAANSTKQRNLATAKALKISSEVKVPVGARSVRSPKWHQSLLEPDASDEETSSSEEEEEKLEVMTNVDEEEEEEEKAVGKEASQAI